MAQYQGRPTIDFTHPKWADIYWNMQETGLIPGGTWSGDGYSPNTYDISPMSLNWEGDPSAMKKAAFAEAIKRGDIDQEKFINYLKQTNSFGNVVSNPDGTISYDAYTHDDEFDPGNLIIAAGAAGVGALSGGFGLSSLFDSLGGAASGFVGEDLAALGLESGFPSVGAGGTAGTGFTSAIPTFKGSGGSDWFGNPDFLDSINYDFGQVGGATNVDMTGFLSQGADPFAFTPDPNLATGGAGGVGTLTGGNLGEFSLAQLPGGSLSSGLGVLGVAAPAGVEPSIWQKAVEFIKNGKSVAEVGKIFGLGEGATKILGSLGASALGAIGSSAQSDAYERLAREYMGYGAPYRGRLS